MLPTVVASELRDAVSRFLRSAFPIATRYFQASEYSETSDPHALIDRLLEEPGALFKGPYLDIKLPFRVAEEAELPFRHLQLPFAPYQHQLSAFRRLAGDAPKPTIVATGTGSGKTECFMYPVLDDCLTRREQGIKAIIVYPMNALASDQARRFADEVRKLDTQLTVGLFVGGEQANAHATMGADHVITSHQTLRNNPPDILLTNYKMLDFLLIRPQDRPLWRFNKPGMLRYLVVDELHTFDGAQGTDLACLIRRLRDRLDVGPELACAGTSATIGSNAEEALIDYASQVFASQFPTQAVIGEDRLSAEEYLRGDGNTGVLEPAEHRHGWPERDEARLDPERYECVEDYLFHQARIWFDSLPIAEIPALNATDPRKRAEAAVRLGELLHQHKGFHALVRATAELRDMQMLAEEWQQKLNLPSVHQAQLMLVSLTSLVSAARLWLKPEDEDPDKWCRPLLHVRQQFWLRELRRLVTSVPEGDESPRIRFADDLHDPQSPLHMPVLHCRECNLAAWGAVARKGDPHLNCDLQSFYQAWFGYSPQSRLLVPRVDGEAQDPEEQAFCPGCLRLQRAGEGKFQCAECGRDGLLRVSVPDMLQSGSGDNERLRCHHNCPECGARESLAVMGYRAATLTSVMAGRLFGTPYNDDFKLIAFSDSVQDAAHRAGFLGANTWRQVLRHAMGAWLREQPVALSLRDMTELLPAYWRDRVGDDARFCGNFIAPNMAWIPDYRALTQQGRLPPNTDLPDLVSRRLAWECLAEFGRRGTLGRSMERTGQAAVGFDAEALARDVGKFAERVREEVGQLRDVEDDVLLRFVVGWMQHARQVGAIYDSVLDGYLGNKGKEYLLNRLPWMPGFGRARRPPAAFSLEHVAPNFEAILLKNRETWSLRWLKKTIGAEELFAAAEGRQFFQLLLDVLTKAGWLIEPDGGGHSLWMLNPSRLLISDDVCRLECSHCRHVLHVAGDAVGLCDRMPCLRGACSGLLVPASGPGDDSGERYGITAPRRLVPSEHTGLLPREERDAVEQSFMQGEDPWDINLLSATPTLEVGIDIGALSSVFLCSVPPAQANYLQRIGRAGRRDGNALAVTVANGQNHDLFFYSDPLEMIAGDVHTPGVFLKAIAVLERQMIAYCFDRWNATGVDAAAIPGQMRKVLDAVEHQHEEQFPHTLIGFIRRSREALLDGFFNLFPELDDEARQYLRSFMRNESDGGLQYKLLERLQQLVQERQSWLKQVSALKSERERLKKQPEDEATRELIDAVEHERSALISLLYGMNNQPVLNFFTDEGLLPNYAFPEAGVTLRSVILRRRSERERAGNDSAFEKTPYAFQRSAQAALSELAPESRFYAVSHEMEIDQVDLDLCRAETWRFCARCHYHERVDVTDKHSACPRCFHPQWADSGQKHSVLQLRQVYSTVDDRSSRIGDESEQREPQFFNRQMLVDVPQGGNQGGFRLKSDTLPFGFEFLDRVTLREVNFGPAGADTHTFSVADKELPRRGFRICRHCGKVQKERFRGNERPHSYTCKLYKNPENATEEDFFDSLYLYRQLNSEAIRILLPLSEVAYSDEKLHSFIAALNLGLRTYFQGDVHHLEVTNMHEPATEHSGERVYLVVYDRIPGGTGYLKELMRAPDRMMQVLEAAHRRLTSCSCIDDPVLDGCYRCILAYRDSRNMATISRAGAAELLGEILALRDQLEEVNTLSTISTNALIESVLEQRFIDALKQLPGARMSKQLVNGKTGHLLTLESEGTEPVPWQVEHQVKVGPDSGVPVQTEIDVVLRPARAKDAERYRAIAVYMDGLQYHKDRVGDDVRKRSGLLQSGQYWVYSLTWDDLPEPGKPAKAQAIDLMSANGPEPRMAGLYDGLASRKGWMSALDHGAAHATGSLAWLTALLRDPAAASQWLLQRGVYRGMTTLAPGAVKDAAQRERFRAAAARCAPSHVRDVLDIDNPAVVPGGLLADQGGGMPGIELVASLPMTAMRSEAEQDIIDGLQVLLWFDDQPTQDAEDFKNRWRAFWHAANQLQFQPGFFLATQSAVQEGGMEQLWALWQAMAPEVTAAGGEQGDETAWAEVFELSVLDPETIQALLDLGVPEPELGVDIARADGEVVLSGENVELCWRDQGVAVVNSEPSADLTEWRFVLADDDLVARIGALHEQGVL